VNIIFFLDDENNDGYKKDIPFAFEVAFGCQGVRPMSLEIP